MDDAEIVLFATRDPDIFRDVARSIIVRHRTETPRKMSWAKQQRMNFVAELLRRTGFINRKHLAAKFGISIPQASADLATFMRLNPGALIYNKTTKRFERAAEPPVSA